MSDYDPAAYGNALGAEYDQLYSDSEFETDAAVAALTSLAGFPRNGSILEFGVGTGRLALPLRELGFGVVGIEASRVMVEQLRAKPGGAEIPVVVGDFTTARVDGRFSVVVLAVNGITDPPTRDAQIACFQNAARHLDDGGCFVLETYVLGPEHLRGGWSVSPRLVARDRVELQIARYDARTSRLERTMVHLRPDGVRLIPLVDNYAWPGELDLMARSAGLRLRARHAGWREEPFDTSSRRHVSIYEREDA